MRSIPLFFGGDFRHLRFTFGAVEDIDQLMPDGFMSVFEREADVQICHLLLWAGFENMSYDEVGLILSQHPDLTSLWRAITYALINDEWINVTKRNDQKEDQDHKTLQDVIRDLERMAVSDLNMKPSDFYALTPREFNLMLENYGIRDNLRAGVICSTMANIHSRRENDRPFVPGDFLRCGKESRKESQSPQEQSAIINTLMGG